jgi:hypothetical protein
MTLINYSLWLAEPLLKGMPLESGRYLVHVHDLMYLEIGLHRLYLVPRPTLSFSKLHTETTYTLKL